MDDTIEVAADDNDKDPLLEPRKNSEENGNKLPRSKEKNCRNIVISIFSTIASIIFSLLIGAWSKIAFDEIQTTVTFIVLIIIACVGTLALLVLYKDIFINAEQKDNITSIQSTDPSEGCEVPKQKEEEEDKQRKDTFHRFKKWVLLKHERSDKFSSIWKIKHGFLFTFAGGYLAHCGWYCAKAVFCADDVDSSIRIAYNIISSIFTFLQLLFFVIHKNMKFTFKRWSQFIAFFVMFQNSCIWFDALLSESAGIFDKNDTVKHENKSNCSHNEVAYFIENADTFLTPMMIEYSLLAIQMLYAISKPDKERQSKPEGQGAGEDSKTKEEICCSIFISTLSLMFFCFTAAFFMFSLYVTMLGSDDSMALFTTFVSFQLTCKTCMLFFLSIILMNILCMNWKDIKVRPFDVGKVSLLFSGCGNVLNCMFDLYPVLSLNDSGEKLSFTHSIICICLECVQNVVLFIVPEKYSRIMQCCYPQLAILNFGLWACGSIGEIRVHTFTEIQYKYYKKSVWMVNTKIVLPVTIFYRFHCAMEFLELWVESSNVQPVIISEEESTPPQHEKVGNTSINDKE